MKQDTILTADSFESTYALLVRSEEKERTIFEDLAYLAFILSAIFSIWHMAQTPVELPTALHTTSVVQTTETQES